MNIKHPPLTEKEAALYTNRSPRTLQMYRHLGKPPAYLKVGRSILYRIEDLDAFLDAGRVEPRNLK